MDRGSGNWVNRTLYIRDNLDILRGMNSDTVDLIYLDPPFNSNRDYEAPIGSKAAGAAFKDSWHLSDVDLAWHGEVAEKNQALYDVISASRTAHGKGMMSYLVMMSVRLIELERVLKPTGSIYLHCDPTASHYLKMVMDSIFGKNMFRNEIVWERIKGAGKRSQHASRSFGKVVDYILLYSKSDTYHLDLEAVAVPLEKEDLKKFNRTDSKGVYYRRSPFRPPGLGDRPNLCFTYKGIANPHPSGWVGSIEFIKELDEQGDIEFVDNKCYRKQRPKGTPIHSLWKDIPQVGGNVDTGYPTQKPLPLLERIIMASSNEGDLILDPFCGCATTMVAAEKLGRQWIGIDISPQAKALIENRMAEELGFPSLEIDYLTEPPKRTDLPQVYLPEGMSEKRWLYGKQEGRCAGCRELMPPKNLTTDHIIPRSKGGHSHLDNYQLLCGWCNSSKGNRTQEEFLASLRERGLRR